MKRLLAVILVLLLIFAASCGSTATPDPTPVPEASPDASGAAEEAPAEEEPVTEIPIAEEEPQAADLAAEPAPSGEPREITVGAWYDQYYTSDHTDIYDNPQVTNEVVSQMQLDNMREIEQKYNITFRFVNLTWEGVIESINTSIMAGAPDVDMYLVDLQFGVPAVLNGYAQDLHSFLPDDHDIFTSQNVLKYMNVLGAEEDYLFAQNLQNGVTGYPLGFNLDLLQQANLEDPREVYKRGEWTWDVWRQYLQTLTQDTDGDSVTDIYGYGGYWTDTLGRLLFSNKASIAAGTTEGLSSPETIEVLEFYNTIYNVDKSVQPWNDTEWESNLSPFVDGKLAFFETADWLIQGMAESGDALNYELGVVPWPYGPRGDVDSSKVSQTAGAYYFIPVGVEDPELVFNVFNDFSNWHKGDLELRDDDEWSRNQYLTDENYDMALESVSIPGFDMWSMLGTTNFSMIPIFNGERTPAQYAEEMKQPIQDALDAFLGN